MSTCQSCGGVIGRDCFNPQECAWITQSMMIDDAVRRAVNDRDAREYNEHCQREYGKHLEREYEYYATTELGFDPVSLGM